MTYKPFDTEKIYEMLTDMCSGDAYKESEFWEDKEFNAKNADKTGANGGYWDNFKVPSIWGPDEKQLCPAIMAVWLLNLARQIQARTSHWTYREMLVQYSPKSGCVRVRVTGGVSS
jgi:hypothetical protein